ncbi:Exopolysaccharide biosynthesis protein-like protein [Psychromonas ingrahamii 37]|uniref:Exopolysaccharide biosynthesis protein-like protein n=1 Tax=Psychromonas ingrahamii (strain DSM 17664 / CCUG 51855 / 37) TaxID=357804 RepID=A1SRS6_PSYIN|nr:DUF1919 domain-containing protein [Psychromonas ingrahamii]ABM02191.1 Exopolysaccharide biosynthesis protein-like protein [Psychromonas ingrahamii 37]
MRIEIGRKVEKYIKSRLSRLKLKQNDFTIISNNCWGTFMYKKFALPYTTPFVNLLIFSPDYIELLENLTPELLTKISFIEHENSQHKEEMVRLNIYKKNYPIGILDNKYELHFLHYQSQQDAKDKWLKRLARMNFDKLIVKFSASLKFEDNMAERFDDLNFKNKICFTATAFPNLKSIVSMQAFKGKETVIDEWKHTTKKEFDLINFINNIQREDKA